MGFFSNLDIEAYDRQYTDRELLKGMGTFFLPHVRRIALITVLLLVIAFSSAALPILVAWGVDMLEENTSMLIIAGLTAGVLASGIIVWAANWWRRRLTSTCR